MDEILDKYKLQEILGSGATCVVRKALHKQSNQSVAIKMISKLNNNVAKAKNEIQVITRLDHPNVISIYDVYEEDEGIYIVMEYMAGGELYERIAQKISFTEYEVCNLLRKLVDAVRYIHDMEVIHRDIKPENMLLTSKLPDATLKLADFGLAKILSDELLTTNCGTPVYMAPEILAGKEYDQSVDIWSIGVTMYYLLSGDLPFKGEMIENLEYRINNEQLEFPYDSWGIISFRAKNLIQRMLSVDPAKRPTPRQILEDPWFAENNMEIERGLKLVELDYVVKKIKKNTLKKKVKRCVNGVYAVIKLVNGVGVKKKMCQFVVV